MRSIFFCVVLSFLTLVPIGLGSPITGVVLLQKKLDPGESWQTWKETKRFQGGERTAVLVRGSNPVGAGIHLKVFDANGKLVAEDKGTNPPVADMVAVFWYPPRDAEYRIEIENLDSKENLQCYVTFK